MLEKGFEYMQEVYLRYFDYWPYAVLIVISLIWLMVHYRKKKSLLC